jgi:[ribosomal protein S5]-alanine N-acetyltransferase
MNTLSTGSLRLEPLVVAHAHEMYRVLSDPAIYEFENEPPSSEAALAGRYLALERRKSLDGTQQWLNWVIRVQSGDAAGYVQATVLSGGHAYVAYELASRFWRQGIGSAAVAAALHELRVHYAVEHAWAVFKAANFRSRGLLAKLGFSHTPPGLASPWPSEPDELVLHKPLAAVPSAV